MQLQLDHVFAGESWPERGNHSSQGPVESARPTSDRPAGGPPLFWRRAEPASASRPPPPRGQNAAARDFAARPGVCQGRGCCRLAGSRLPGLSRGSGLAAHAAAGRGGHQLTELLGGLTAEGHPAFFINPRASAWTGCSPCAGASPRPGNRSAAWTSGRPRKAARLGGAVVGCRWPPAWRLRGSDFCRATTRRKRLKIVMGARAL